MPSPLWFKVFLAAAFVCVAAIAAVAATLAVATVVAFAGAATYFTTCHLCLCFCLMTACVRESREGL